MKASWILVLLPSFALAGAFAGTVLDLNGTPVEGAVVTTGVETVVSGADGNWSVARSTGVRQRISRPQAVTSHLSVSHGGLGISWNGFAPNGRRDLSMPPPPTDFAFRQLEATPVDTLRIYWKDKRLVQLPITSADSSDITLKIDTAWQDDFGIPWNPRVEYGSLFDERDGNAYRTVKVLDQTWLAENLRFATDRSRCSQDQPDSCAKFGRLYTWSAAMAVAAEFDSARLPEPDSLSKGICPAGSRLPTNEDWNKLLHPTSLTDRGNELGALLGWVARYPENFAVTPYVVVQRSFGTDNYGFRTLHTPTSIGWWTSAEDLTQGQEPYANVIWYVFVGRESGFGADLWFLRYTKPKSDLYPIRCLVD